MWLVQLRPEYQSHCGHGGIVAGAGTPGHACPCAPANHGPSGRNSGGEELKVCTRPASITVMKVPTCVYRYATLLTLAVGQPGQQLQQQFAGAVVRAGHNHREAPPPCRAAMFPLASGQLVIPLKCGHIPHLVSGSHPQHEMLPPATATLVPARRRWVGLIQ
jgi:hypothetical protein